MAHEPTNTRVFTGSKLAVSIRTGIGFGRLDSAKWHEFPINQSTGKINIPQKFLWKDIKSVTEARKREADRLTGFFQATVGFQKTDECLVLVTSRDHTNTYRAITPRNRVNNDLVTCHLLPVQVLARGRNEAQQSAENTDPVAVLTATKGQNNQQASNRIDVWIVEKDGTLKSFQILLITQDDGKSFRVTGKYHWEGKIYRLPVPFPHESMDPKTASLFDQDAIRKLAEQIIIVPDGRTYPGFDTKANILEMEELRTFITANLSGFSVWEGPERNFPISIGPEMPLKGNRGVVKFWSNDRQAGGFGIVEQHDHNGQPVASYQFNRHTLISDPDNPLFDEQGLPEIAGGDIVKWTSVIDMGARPDGKKHPPLITNVEVTHEVTAY